MKRTYVEFGNKHFKEMSVVFSGQNHDILTLFLTSEVTNFSSDILEEFRRVTSGTGGSAGFCGNSIELEFDSEKADLYYSIPTSDSNFHYSIATSL